MTVNPKNVTADEWWLCQDGKSEPQELKTKEEDNETRENATDIPWKMTKTTPKEEIIYYNT